MTHCLDLAQAFGKAIKRRDSILSSGKFSAKTAVSDHHPDAVEGIAAFVEKRDAKFNRDLP